MVECQAIYNDYNSANFPARQPVLTGFAPRDLLRIQLAFIQKRLPQNVVIRRTIFYPVGCFMRVKSWIKKPAVVDISLETKMSFEYVCRDDTLQKKDYRCNCNTLGHSRIWEAGYSDYHRIPSSLPQASELLATR